MRQKQESKVYNPGRFVKNTFIAYLRAMFKINGGQYGLGYVDNETESDLLIYDAQSLDMTTIGDIPAIGIDRGPWACAQVNPNAMQSFNSKNGVITFSDLIRVPIVLMCISRNGAEAEFMASLSANFLQLDKRALTALGIHSITNIEVGGEQRVPEQPELTMVRVNTVAFIQVFWQAATLPERQLNEIRNSIKIKEGF